MLIFHDFKENIHRLKFLSYFRCYQKHFVEYPVLLGFSDNIESQSCEIAFLLEGDTGNSIRKSRFIIYSNLETREFDFSGDFDSDSNFTTMERIFSTVAGVVFAVTFSNRQVTRLLPTDIVDDINRSSRGRMFTEKNECIPILKIRRNIRH